MRRWLSVAQNTGVFASPSQRPSGLEPTSSCVANAAVPASASCSVPDSTATSVCVQVGPTIEPALACRTNAEKRVTLSVRPLVGPGIFVSERLSTIGEDESGLGVTASSRSEI